jgi:hypothetical protein
MGLKQNALDFDSIEIQGVFVFAFFERVNA